MNERIKELANIWANRRAEDEKLGIVYTFSEPALEQFAELIVKKCMDVAKYHTPDTEECEHTWLIHDKIAKHFGVEE
jgi:hypothetical protein